MESSTAEALDSERLTIFKVLLRHHADPNLKFYRTGSTVQTRPLLAALMHPYWPLIKSYEWAEILLKNGADLNISAEGSDGNMFCYTGKNGSTSTALHTAARRQFYHHREDNELGSDADLVGLLVQYGAIPDAATKPLLLSLRRPETDEVQPSGSQAKTAKTGRFWSRRILR